MKLAEQQQLEAVQPHRLEPDLTVEKVEIAVQEKDQFMLMREGMVVERGLPTGWYTQ